MEGQPKISLRGELALLLIIILNSFGVVLMLHSGSGISAISSVPYAFSQAFPFLSLGTWTYLFQSLLVLSLMVLRKRLVVSYLLSFAVGFAFGKMVDVHEWWVAALPLTLPLRVLYFSLSYLILCFGVALSNRCQMPIVPTDLFPRELSAIARWPYARVKISFDLICVCTTALITFLFLGAVRGLGIGTILAAFTMGKTISLIGHALDRRFVFVSCLKHP